METNIQNMLKDLIDTIKQHEHQGLLTQEQAKQALQVLKWKYSNVKYAKDYMKV